MRAYARVIGAYAVRLTSRCARLVVSLLNNCMEVLDVVTELLAGHPQDIIDGDNAKKFVGIADYR